MTSALDITPGNVVDIGGSAMQYDLGEILLYVLQSPRGRHHSPTLPDELLYDDIGLPIWNQIIFTPEFYQTHDEIVLLNKHGQEIASRVKSGVTIVDLGAGDTRKVEHLLDAFEKAQKPATYLALDISKASLEQNVAYLAKRHESPESDVTCAGIWGTFQDGQRYAHTIKGPRLFLSLGSVLCNDPWVTAVGHLRSWREAMRPGDMLLIGMDGHMAENNRGKLWKAYHSREDLYRRFFLNGFDHANRLIGHKLFREEDWDFGAELEEQPTTRHRFYFRSNKTVECSALNRVIEQGEEFDWFDSHKYDENSVQVMCAKAGLRVVDIWKAPGSEFRQYLIKLKDSNDPREDDDSGVSGLS